MISNTFNNLGKESLSQLELNKSNGIDGEHLAVAHLTLALKARVTWGSRSEDNSKVDLNTIFNNPWRKNEVQNIFTQVKSGSTFASVEISNNKLKLKVKSEEFEDYKKRDHNTLVCWVDRNHDELYWFVIKKNAFFFRAEYGLSHKLSPATRFDITRLINSFVNNGGGKGLSFSINNKLHPKDYERDDFLMLRKRAKKCYKNLKSTQIINPLFGHVEITRYGWRHMTRESRYNPYVVSSFEIIPILKSILKTKPSKHFIQNCDEEWDKDNFFRKTEFIVEYQGVVMVNSEVKTNVNVYIKLMEFISYPINWKTNSQLSQKVKRRVVFRSVYYK